MLRKSPIDCKVSGAFLCLLIFSCAALAEAFSSRDQNPLALIHGLPLPSSAVLTPAGEFSWLTSYHITNTLNVENQASEALFFDYESHELTINLNYGLANNWALRLDIPLIYYGGGFLDNAIDNWHQAFGLPRAGRQNYASDAFRLNYQTGATTVLDIDEPNSSLADIQLGIGRQLFNSSAHAASLWLSADLPSGSQSKLSGSGKTDFVLQLASQHRLHPRWLLDANLALILPGDAYVNTARVAAHIWSAQSGIEWRAHPLFDLRLQLAGHSQIYPDSALKFLGNSVQLVFGGRLHLDQCRQFDLAVSEDIKSGASPDVVFNFSYRQLGHCK